MTALVLAWSVAQATDAFDPTTPQARFDGRETWTQVEDVRLWSALERYDDPDRTLFHLEAFNQGTGWRDTDASPWIATAFGTATPPSSSFLLHIGLNEATASGTPVLMVPGAGDNGSRAYVTLGTKLDRIARPVYALTFAHPHGDLFLQAEAVANAIAVIKVRTGADQVDVVGHSKGGVSVAVYAASGEAEALGDAAYVAVGTPYRGDIRKLVLIATPMGGVDTSYRWTGLNLFGLDADIAISPTSWERYYPSGTIVPLVFDELVDQDFLPDGRDLFPGQRQLLQRQGAPLPGSQAWMGVYALQPDWYTTYEGGLGFLSRSDGIDVAIAAGNGFIDRLAAAGLDPDIAVYQLAGTSPVLPNGDDALAAQFGLLADTVDWPELLAELANHGGAVTAAPEELAGLQSGALVLGEITGRSDGLVFLTSAVDDRAITARGGTVIERYDADLSHLDLLYASPVTGALLVDAADAGGPEDAWMRAYGERYTAADTLGFLERVLADPPGPTPTTPTTDEDTGSPAPTAPYQRPCGSCDVGGNAKAPGLLMALLALWRRRRKA